MYKSKLGRCKAIHKKTMENLAWHAAPHLFKSGYPNIKILGESWYSIPTL